MWQWFKSFVLFFSTIQKWRYAPIEWNRFWVFSPTGLYKKPELCNFKCSNKLSTWSFSTLTAENIFLLLVISFKKHGTPQPQRPLEESYVNTLCWYFLTSATTPITATSCFWTWFVLISMYSVPLVYLTIESSDSSPMDTSCVFTSVMMVVLLVLPFLCTKLINLVDTSENLWLFN